MRYTYELTPRPLELGGGWRLRLLEDELEVGGGVFPITAIEPSGALSETQRALLLTQAYDEAEAEALDWIADKAA